MTEVALQTLVEEARQKVRSDSYDEAIALCRHILRYYPKYIEPYLVLGEACLEKGQADEAADLFKRVLSADPHNFLAYVGLGIIYEQEGLLDEAIWQFERAFELRPAQAEVRDRLRSLYAQREGIERPRLKLNRAALGHLYVKGRFYAQAIAEFNEILEQDPERVDIQLALAEALWRDNRRREAADLCQDILNKLPNCLKANLLLGEIWLNSGLEDEGQTLLRRAENMDPENLVAEALFGAASPLPRKTVTIERPAELEEVPGPAPVIGAEQVAPLTETESAEWARALQEASAEGEAVAAEVTEEEAEIAPEKAVVAQEESPVISALEEEFGAVPSLAVEEIGAEERAALEASMPPEDASPEEIMAWLNRMRGRAAETLPEVAPAEEIPAPEEVALAPEAEVVAEEATAEAPEAITAEELIGAEEVIPAEVEATAEEVIAETPEAAVIEEPVKVEEEVVPAPEVEMEAIAEAPEAAVIEELVEAEEVVSVPEAEVIAEEAVAEAPEVAVAEELVEAKEEIAAAPEEVATVEEVVAKAPELAIVEELAIAAPEVAAAPTIADYLARLQENPADHLSRLALARAYTAESNWKGAAEAYATLVASAPATLGEVIADLESLVAEQPKLLELQQVLGDAYMEAGELDKALAKYNWLLTQVS